MDMRRRIAATGERRLVALYPSQPVTPDLIRGPASTAAGEKAGPRLKAGVTNRVWATQQARSERHFELHHRARAAHAVGQAALFRLARYPDLADRRPRADRPFGIARLVDGAQPVGFTGRMSAGSGGPATACIAIIIASRMGPLSRFREKLTVDYGKAMATLTDS
jgi:hypothetical protein